MCSSDLSGQVTLRAEVPNPEKRLLPGLFVRVRLEQAQAGGAVLLPQRPRPLTLKAVDDPSDSGEGAAHGSPPR